MVCKAKSSKDTPRQSKCCDLTVSNLKQACAKCQKDILDRVLSDIFRLPYPSHSGRCCVPYGRRPKQPDFNEACDSCRVHLLEEQRLFAKYLKCVRSVAK